MKEAHDLATCVVSPSSQACIDEEDVRGGRKGKILTLGATNSSWRKIDVINDNKPGNFSMECIFLNGVVYWYSRNSSVVYFNFREKFGYILLPNPETLYSLGMPSIIRSALCGKLVMQGPLLLLVYDDIYEVITTNSWRGNDYISVAATLFGAERINDKKMKEEANVLATASVMSAPASLLSCYSSSCNLRFVSSSADHNNNKKCPLIVYKNVSSFVENIIPLTSLLG